MSGRGNMGGPGRGMGDSGGEMEGPGGGMGGPGGGNSGDRPEMHEEQNQSTSLSKKSFGLTFYLSINNSN